MAIIPMNPISYRFDKLILNDIMQTRVQKKAAITYCLLVLLRHIKNKFTEPACISNIVLFDNINN